MPAGLIGLASGLRLVGLGSPAVPVFDETYYVPDAVRYLQNRGGEVSFVQPPGGKWLIAAGIRLLGNNPWGWRISAAVAGTLVVLWTYQLGLTWWRSSAWAGLAGLLVCLDGLELVQSRTAMLDIFAAAAIILAALIVARAQTTQRSEFRTVAYVGVVLGVGLSIKWETAPVLLGLAVYLIVRSPSRRRTLASVLVGLVLLPLVVYFCSYAQWWWDHGLAVDQWWRLQVSMFDFHRDLRAVHPYASRAWTWPLLLRPVAYFFRSLPGGRVQEVLALGNPVLWWSFLVTLPFLARQWLRRADPAIDLVLLGWATVYLPWLAVQRPEFLYYATPLVPFMALGVVAVLKLPGRRAARRCALLVLVADAAGTALLWPLWTGTTISRWWWSHLLLIHSWL